MGIIFQSVSISDDELMFLNLYQQSHTDLAKFMDISEYPLSSRKSIPLDENRGHQAGDRIK